MELIVVVGIIGILAGVLLATFGGSTASARSARCLSNMRNLAAACQTYASVAERYPFAGSIEYMKIDESQGIARAKALYQEVPGWISWASMGAYRNKPNSHQASAAWFTSMYSADRDQNLYCLTNGAVWRYVSGDRQTYVCPDHVKKAERSLGTPQWSYVMNAFFGWDSSEGSSTKGQNFEHISYGRLARADRILLFGEIQFKSDCGLDVPSGSDSGTDCDCVLQYNQSAAKTQNHGANEIGGAGNESIGVNHVNGRNLYAHVAFADGHVEKLKIPFSGSIKNPKVDATAMRNLTAWLCTGEDLSFDGRNYRPIDN